VTSSWVPGHHAKHPLTVGLRADVAQVYLTGVAGERRMRLLGFERVELAPGASRRVTVTADPRLLARFDAVAGQWRIRRDHIGLRSAGPPGICR